MLLPVFVLRLSPVVIIFVVEGKTQSSTAAPSSCFIPPLAAVLQRASLPGGLLFIAASPRLRRGHVAARLRASAFTCSLSSVKEGLSLLLQLPPTRELKHCVCKLPPTGKHMCAVCGASDVGAKSHFPRPVLCCRRQGTTPCETSSMHTLPLWVGSWPLELMGYTRRLRAQNRLTLLFSHTFTSRLIHPLLSTRAQLPISISLRSSTFQGKLLSV